MKLTRALLLFLLPSLYFQSGHTHHSFAPYDVHSPSVDINGTVEKFQFMNPHPLLSLTAEDGTSWVIEVATRRWGDIPRDVFKTGDEVTIVMWPRLDGSPEGLMSGFELAGEERIIFHRDATRNSRKDSERQNRTRN